MVKSVTNSIDVFDKVYCISLKECRDRQENARSQLSRIGINRFDFFWGTDKDDELVKEYYESDLVLKFPPCFRCLKRSCGKETCNNFLIPAQVATFISFKRVWEDMIENNVGIAMIVEDDVVFADYAPSLVQSALSKSTFTNLGVTRNSKSLLRLGTSKGNECKITGHPPQYVKGAFRVSNYCFVITLGMAKQLMNNFRKIETTVDNYIHYVVGMKVNNYSLFPPIAYDLSWSMGAVDSLIHPKSTRVNYLKQAQPWNSEAIGVAQKKVDRHFFHKLIRKVLSVGHPRCGSAYMSQLLKAHGLDVRHEEMGDDGISSWMFAVEDDENPWAKNKYALSSRYTVFDYVIHHVRDPSSAIPSIVRENTRSVVSYQFRRKHIEQALAIDIDRYPTDLEKATASFLYWNRIIEKLNPDISVRVEDCEEDIFRLLSAHNLTDVDKPLQDVVEKTCNADKLYKGVRYAKPVIVEHDWAMICDELKEELMKFCVEYGYDHSGVR